MLPLIIAFCGRMLYPELLENGDTQMMIPHLVLQHSNLGIQILFFGALLSAILSTCSGAMLAPATVIGENLVRPLFRYLTDAQLLRIMRYSVVGVAVVTGYMAIARNNIYELVGESSAFSLVSLFTPLLAGLNWKRSSAIGAIASMIAGFTVWFVTLLWFGSLPPLPENAEPSAWQTLIQIPPMLYGLGASLLAMAVGSWLYPERRVGY